MNYYHMTPLDRIKSISKFGLTPRNEGNSKLIMIQKIKSFSQKSFGGAIALFIDFDIVYNKIKNGNIILLDKKIENKVLDSNNLFEYLKDGAYLQFDETNIENERNFENGCTSKVIIPKYLNVCILKNIQLGQKYTLDLRL